MDAYFKQQYDNVFQRAAAYFALTCAPEPQDEKKKPAYRFIFGIYDSVYQNAERFGFKPVPDCPLPLYEKQKGREKEIKSIRGAIDKISELTAVIFHIAELGEIRENSFFVSADNMTAAGIKRSTPHLLEACGAAVSKSDDGIVISLPDGCAEGLKELAKISRAEYEKTTDLIREERAHLYFSRCAFEPDGIWLAEAYDKAFGACGKLIGLTKALEERCYRRICCRNAEKITLDYVKNHGVKEEPVKAAWAEREHSGIELGIDEIREKPLFLALRMPMFKAVLSRIGEFDEQSGKFILSRTKSCDNCHYCIQTDKSGKRPIAAIGTANGAKCPLFPGFGFIWYELDEELCEKLLTTIDNINKVL